MSSLSYQPCREAHCTNLAGHPKWEKWAGGAPVKRPGDSHMAFRGLCGKCRVKNQSQQCLTLNCNLPQLAGSPHCRSHTVKIILNPVVCPYRNEPWKCPNLGGHCMCRYQEGLV